MEVNMVLVKFSSKDFSVVCVTGFPAYTFYDFNDERESWRMFEENAQENAGGQLAGELHFQFISHSRRAGADVAKPARSKGFQRVS